MHGQRFQDPAQGPPSGVPQTGHLPGPHLPGRSSTEMKPEVPLMRIGMLTGGGDCPGLNAVIPRRHKSLIRQCGAEVIGIEDGFLSA